LVEKNDDVPGLVQYWILNSYWLRRTMMCQDLSNTIIFLVFFPPDFYLLSLERLRDFLDFFFLSRLRLRSRLCFFSFLECFDLEDERFLSRDLDFFRSRDLLRDRRLLSFDRDRPLASPRSSLLESDRSERSRSRDDRADWSRDCDARSTDILSSCTFSLCCLMFWSLSSRPARICFSASTAILGSLVSNHSCLVRMSLQNSPMVMFFPPPALMSTSMILRR